jgi:hypothetical protein
MERENSIDVLGGVTPSFENHKNMFGQTTYSKENSNNKISKEKEEEEKEVLVVEEEIYDYEEEEEKEEEEIEDEELEELEELEEELEEEIALEEELEEKEEKKSQWELLIEKLKKLTNQKPIELNVIPDLIEIKKKEHPLLTITINNDIPRPGFWNIKIETNFVYANYNICVCSIRYKDMEANVNFIVEHDPLRAIWKLMFLQEADHTINFIKAILDLNDTTILLFRYLVNDLVRYV